MATTARRRGMTTITWPLSASASSLGTWVLCKTGVVRRGSQSAPSQFLTVQTWMDWSVWEVLRVWESPALPVILPRATSQWDCHVQPGHQTRASDAGDANANRCSMCAAQTSVRHTVPKSLHVLCCLVYHSRNTYRERTFGGRVS
jgi:hypothetical protein